MTTNVALFVLAAVLEIGGCCAFWVWIRRGAAAWVVVLGIASLVGFALALTRIDSAFAGRAWPLRLTIHAQQLRGSDQGCPEEERLVNRFKGGSLDLDGSALRCAADGATTAAS